MRDTRTVTLEEALLLWIAENESNPRVWQTPAGRVIRGWMKERGNFKNAPRGNPKKGWEAQRRRAEGLTV